MPAEDPIRLALYRARDEKASAETRICELVAMLDGRDVGDDERGETGPLDPLEALRARVAYWRSATFDEQNARRYAEQRVATIREQVGALVRQIEQDDRAPLRFGGSAEALDLAGEVTR
jgi:hypothetical protein